MFIFISPAKKLRSTLVWSEKFPTEINTEKVEASQEYKVMLQVPDFLEQSHDLIECLKRYSTLEIMQLMKLSEPLAKLNHERYASWSIQAHHNLLQADVLPIAAVYQFQGDVYQGLQADSFSEEQLQWAQRYLRILSGLYGVLRPQDIMLHYRLEMGTKLSVEGYAQLYDYWQAQGITEYVNKEIALQKSKYVVNLASQEYARVISWKNVGATVITPIFKDQKNGQYKVISFYAKKARGLMARFLIDQQITEPEQLQAFDREGYYFHAYDEKKHEIVYHRDEIVK